MSDAALAATAEALARRVLADVPADRPRGEADVDRLPAPLVPLLRARLAGAVALAAPRETAWIDADAVREAAQTWRQAAQAAVAVPAGEWAQAVREAAGLALAHLVRPAETLAATAFEGGQDRLAVDVALDHVRAFGPYPYLPQIAARYAERKALDTIDRVGLEQLLLRIDRRMVSTFGPDDWTTLLGPVVGLVGPLGSPAGSVPTRLLRLLFESKGADALAAELAGIDAVSPDELRALLERVLVPSPSPPVEAREAPPEDAQTPDPTPAEETPTEETPDERSPETPTVSPASRPETEEAPPLIGSKYLAPEYDGADESGVLGPPRPAGSGSPAPERSPAGLGDAPLDPADEAAEEGPTWAAEPVRDEPAPTGTGPDLPHDTAEAPMDEVRDAVTAPAPTDVPDDEPVAPPSRSSTSTSFPRRPCRPAARALGSATRHQTRRPTTSRSTTSPSARSTAPPGGPARARRTGRRRAPVAAPGPRAGRRAVPDPGRLGGLRGGAAVEAVRPVRPRSPAPRDARPRGPGRPQSRRRAGGGRRRSRRQPDPGRGREPGPGAGLARASRLVCGRVVRRVESEYHQTLDRIDQARTYTEATGIVSADVFRAHRVNPYTDSAVAFIDAVQAQFGAD